MARPMSAYESIIARLLTLHPKLIDLSLDRMWRILARARPSGAAAAAGDPCRRHQRQGLDHRLHARHAGGGGPQRACLHLAASGALQRALPARRAGRRPARRATTSSADALDRMRARQCRRADHGVRDHDRGGASAVLAPSGRRAAARSRARRPARRHQRGRRPLASVITPVSIDHAEFLGDTHRQDRGREGRHPQARRAGGRRAAGRRACWR